MRPAGPPHYRAFRLTLAVVVLAAVALGVWWTTRPEVLGWILTFLR